MSKKMLTILHLEWIKHQKDLLDLEHRLLQQELENEIGAKYDYQEKIEYYEDLKTFTIADKKMYEEYKTKEIKKSEIAIGELFILNNKYLESNVESTDEVETSLGTIESLSSSASLGDELSVEEIENLSAEGSD